MKMINDYYKKSLKIYFRFLTFLKPYWKVGVVAGFLMILAALLQLPAPLLTKHLIDTIVPAKNVTSLNLFALLLVGVILVGNAINYLRSYLLITYRNKVETDIRSLLFKKIISSRLGCFEQTKVGYLESRIDNDVDAAGKLFLETILEIGINGLTFIVGVCLCFYLNTGLAVVSLLSLPLFLFSFHYFSKKMNGLTRDRQEKWAVLRGNTVEYLAQAKIIKAFNKIKDIFTIYMEGLRDAIVSQKKLELYNVLSGIFIGLTGVLLPLFVLWFGVREIILDRFTVGGFIAFNTCVAYLYDPIKSFVSLNINIHSALAAAERLFEILDYEEEDEQFGNKEIQNIESIDLKNVTFYYNKQEKRGITGISFSLRKTQSLAIVGETGKGKSTIARLILGFDVPQEGELTINGEDYKTFDLKAIRRNVAYVPQEPELLAGNIKDNITFFSDHYEDEYLNEIIKICTLDNSLNRFVDGLNTDVFEAGTGLSGGEKQRIAIARALINKPDILLLDEATSAIDPETEAVLIDNLMNLHWKPGIIMITHRYTWLEKFDRIFRLEKLRDEGKCRNANSNQRSLNKKSKRFGGHVERRQN